MSDSAPRPGAGPRRFRGVVFFMLCLALAAGAVTAAKLGYVERARNRLWGRAPRLSAGDFPAGVSAPVGEVASIPARPVVLGLVPRGGTAALLWAVGDGERSSLFRTGYALEVVVKPYPREDELRRALVRGGDGGGVDVAALPVSTLAMSATGLRDAAPRAVLLLARSQGEDALGVVPGITSPASLLGRRVGTEPKSASHYLALWVLSRAGLTLRDVTLVPLESAAKAGAALASGQVDAAAGPAGVVGPAAREKGGALLSSTSDAPHLIATVLVARGDFRARYPDAIRRLVRGALDANERTAREPALAARALGLAAPELGDPSEALSTTSLATLKDNLAFFGLGGDTPVTYAEAYQSALLLQAKLSALPPPADVEDTADTTALKYVAAAKP